MGAACSSTDSTKNEVAKDDIDVDGKTEEAPPAPAPPKLTVKIVCARNLRNADWFPGTGQSDCYVVLKTGNTEHHKTQVKNDTLDPIWDEECEIKELADDTDLEFYIYDKDVLSSEPLGKAILKSEVFAETGFNAELEVDDPNKKEDEGKGYLKIKVKLADKDFPVYPNPQFVISAERSSKDQPFGLDIDLQDGTSLYVKEIKDGPFKEWNDSKPEQEQLKLGDYIVKVNGVQGSSKELLQQFQSELKAECLVRRGITQRIIFDRPEAEESVGLRFSVKPKGDFLVVLAVEGGAAAQHNLTAEEGQKLLPGDRIISVAGSKGTGTELLEAISAKTGKYHLVIKRPGSNDGGLSASAVHVWG